MISLYSFSDNWMDLSLTNPKEFIDEVEGKMNNIQTRGPIGAILLLSMVVIFFFVLAEMM